MLELRLSALLKLQRHSRLNTWLLRIVQRQLQDETRNIYVLVFGTAYIRDLTVYNRGHHQTNQAIHDIEAFWEQTTIIGLVIPVELRFL